MLHPPPPEPNAVSSAGSGTPTRGSGRLVLIWSVVLLALVWLHVGFLLQEDRADRKFVMISCVAAAAAGVAGMVAGTTRRRRGMAMPAALLLTAASLVLAVNLANMAYLDWARAVRRAGLAEDAHAVLRASVRNYHWPNYGRPLLIESWAKIGIFAVAAGACAGLLWRACRLMSHEPRRGRAVGAVVLATLAATIWATASAYVDRGQRWDATGGEGNWPVIYERLTDSNRLGVAHAVARYNVYQRGETPEVGVFNLTHYPVGPLVLYGPAGPVAGRWLLAAFVLLVTPAATGLAAKTWGGSWRVAGVAALLAAVNAELLMQATLYPAVGVVPFAAAGLACVGYATGVGLPRGHGRPLRHWAPAAVLLGVVFWSGLLLSFAIGFWAIVTAAALVLAWAIGDRTGVRAGRYVLVAVVAGGTWAASTLLTDLLTGYNGFTAIRSGMGGHHQLASAGQLVNDRLYLFESLGNAFGFVSGHVLPVTLGLLAVAALLVGRRERPGRWPLAALGVATLLFLPLGGFSGYFMLETERVWLFLVPGLAVAGAAWAADLVDDEQPVALGMLLLTCVAVATAADIVYLNHLE